MKYAYPAIFTPEDDWILVSFPDLPGRFTDGKDIIEAMTFAGDALNLMLTTLENDEQPIPKPSDIKSLDVPNNSFANTSEILLGFAPASIISAAAIMVYGLVFE